MYVNVCYTLLMLAMIILLLGETGMKIEVIKIQNIKKIKGKIGKTP